MCSHPNNRQCVESLEQKEYQFFLERIPQSLGVGYFRFFAFLTVVIEVCRVLVDYVTIVWQLGLSTDELVAYWSDYWLCLLWPICMLLMYYSMEYLRNYTLRTRENPISFEGIPYLRTQGSLPWSNPAFVPSCFYLDMSLYFRLRLVL